MNHIQSGLLYTSILQHRLITCISVLLINNNINYACYQQHTLKPAVLLHCTHPSKKFITLYCSS